MSAIERLEGSVAWHVPGIQGLRTVGLVGVGVAIKRLAIEPCKDGAVEHNLTLDPSEAHGSFT